MGTSVLREAIGTRFRPCLPSIETYRRQWEEHSRVESFTGPRYVMHYNVLGDGRPLYVIPGICATRKLYAPLLLCLAKHFRVVIYDLPGMQPGDGADLTRLGVEDYPADLFALADHLGDGCFDVIGNSFGSTIAVRALVSEPRRFGRALLVCGFACRPLSWFERFLLRALRRWKGTLGSLKVMRWLSRTTHGRALQYRERALLEFLLSENGQTPVRTAAHQALAVHASDVRGLLRQVTQPVVVVHGHNDRLVTIGDGRQLAEGIPDAQFIGLSHCGHLPHLTHPEYLAELARHHFA